MASGIKRTAPACGADVVQRPPGQEKSRPSGRLSSPKLGLRLERTTCPVSGDPGSGVVGDEVLDFDEGGDGGDPVPVDPPDGSGQERYELEVAIGCGQGASAPWQVAREAGTPTSSSGSSGMNAINSSSTWERAWVRSPSSTTGRSRRRTAADTRESCGQFYVRSTAHLAG